MKKVLYTTTQAGRKVRISEKKISNGFRYVTLSYEFGESEHTFVIMKIRSRYAVALRNLARTSWICGSWSSPHADEAISQAAMTPPDCLLYRSVREAIADLLLDYE